MDLDFSALNNIALQEAEPKPKAGKQTEEKEVGTPAVDLILKAKKAPQEEENKALHRLDGIKRERDNTRQMYGTYQDSIERAGTLRADLLKGLGAGEAPLDLLLKALECISLMTGDKQTYIQGKEIIQDVYGWGLGELAPLKVRLKEAKERLALLSRQELIKPETPPDTQQRIKRAIKAHEKLIKDLENVIEKAEEMHKGQEK